MERICNIPPWEVIFIGDRSTGENQYALRYYPITINGEQTTRVEWYDDKMVYFYVLHGDEYVPTNSCHLGCLMFRGPLGFDLNMANHRFSYKGEYYEAVEPHPT